MELRRALSNTLVARYVDSGELVFMILEFEYGDHTHGKLKYAANIAFWSQIKFDRQALGIVASVYI